MTFILALVAAGVAVWESGAWDWSKFHWKPAAVSFLVFTVPFAIYHCLRASWEIYKDKCRELSVSVDLEKCKVLISQMDELTNELKMLSEAGGSPPHPLSTTSGIFFAGVTGN